MSEDDLKINSRVRKILVEKNLDLSQLGISTSSGTVSIRGTVKKLTERETNDRDVMNLLRVLETTILRTKGVKRVSFSIKKWKKAKGKWVKE